MCGRYVLVQKTEVLAQRYNVSIPLEFDYRPSYNISPGDYAPVITSQEPHVLKLLQFGMTPFWAKKKMYLFNARAEGDRNKENDPRYKGAKEIILKPAFRKAIRSQRCLVPADTFIEGTTKEGLSKPFLVYLQNKVRPFSLAGIYDLWIDKESGEELMSFSIITTVANELMQKLPHHRMPVILSPGDEKKWLSLQTPLTDITKLLVPYPAESMNAYPIGAEIKNPRAEGKKLIEAKGKRLQEEISIRTSTNLQLKGMGNKKKR